MGGSFTWAPFSVADPIYRHRTMGMNLVVFKAVLPYSGLRTKFSLAFLLIIGLNEAVATHVIAVHYGDVLPNRAFIVLLVLAFLFYMPVRHNQIVWRKLYEAEQQVLAEKD